MLFVDWMSDVSAFYQAAYMSFDIARLIPFLECLFQFVAILDHLLDLFVQSRQSIPDKISNLAAGTLTFALVIDQRPDLFQCESKDLSLLDKGDASQYIFTIDPITALGPAWLVKQAALFIKPQRLDANAALLSDVADLHSIV